MICKRFYALWIILAGLTINSYTAFSDSDYISQITSQDIQISPLTRELFQNVYRLRAIVEKFEHRRLHPEEYRNLSSRLFFLKNSIRKTRRKLIQAESSLNRLITTKILLGKRPHPYHLEAIKDYIWLIAQSRDRTATGQNIAYILSQPPQAMSEPFEHRNLLQQTRMMEYGIRRSRQLSAGISLNQYKVTGECKVPSVASSSQEEDMSCPICLDDLSNTEDGVQLGCGHSFCKACLSTYFETAITGKNFPLVCPDQGCQARINANELACSGMSSLQISEWKNHQLQSELRRKKALTHCFTPDCPGLAITTSNIPLQFQCCYCDEHNCAACGEQHQGSCEKYREAQRLNQLGHRSEQLIHDLSQKCPHCQFAVTRVEGEGHCYKMVCPSCKKCWLWVPGKKVGRIWRGYDYHDERGETFSKKEQRIWEKKHRQRYYGQ